MLYALLLVLSFPAVDAATSANWSARLAEAENKEKRAQALEQAATDLAQAPLAAPWTQEAWCDALAEQVAYLLVEAHAPMLATRLACSLERCSGVSQQIFQQAIAVHTREAKSPAGDEDSPVTQDSFAQQRFASAQAFLRSPQAQTLPACAKLAADLTPPERSIAHERLFLALLACQKKGGH